MNYDMRYLILTLLLCIGCALQEPVEPELPFIRPHYAGIDDNGYDRFFVDFSETWPDSMSMQMSLDGIKWGNKFRFPEVACRRYVLFSSEMPERWVRVGLKAVEWHYFTTKVK